MSLARGDRAKFLTVVDNQMADEVQPLYSIDVLLAKSPARGEKCGALVVYRLSSFDLDIPDALTKDREAFKRLMDAKKEAEHQTEEMHYEPIYFRASEGRWVGWALDQALVLYDQLGSARITIKCPRLRISQRLSPRTIASGRSDPRTLFRAAWDIDQLLSRSFAFDPWSKKIRRGRIDAEMAKR